ncbi:MAG: hypothetical protein ACREKN_04135 [Longimicrobiaceae bacterium]
MKTAAGLLTLSLLLVSTGCATNGRLSSGRGADEQITREQIEASTATSAYQLVQTLRPRWLRKRGSQSFANEGDIMVYFDNARMGDPASLRQIPVNAVGSISFFNAAAANFRWGPGHTHGVILVSTRER